MATALGPLLGGALDAGLGRQLGWRCCLFVSAPWTMLTTVTCFRAPLAAGLCRHPAPRHHPNNDRKQDDPAIPLVHPQHRPAGTSR
ncbi:hypothetical protein ACFVY1_32955 [Streptomyces sp. NPDC058293]|uniref:hypothetical protein n=1 Tax=Streptomyces sp. NPDC058293 TaxID=3346429 RepID=UPI0036E0EAE6